MELERSVPLADVLPGIGESLVRGVPLDPDAAEVDLDPLPEAASQQVAQGDVQGARRGVVDGHVDAADRVDHHPAAVVEAPAGVVHPLPDDAGPQHFLTDGLLRQPPVDQLAGGEHAAAEAVGDEALPEAFDPLLGAHPHQHPASVGVLVRLQNSSGD